MKKRVNSRTHVLYCLFSIDKYRCKYRTKYKSNYILKYRYKLTIKRSWTSALVICPLSLSAKVKGFGEVVVIWKFETNLNIWFSNLETEKKTQHFNRSRFSNLEIEK